MRVQKLARVPPRALVAAPRWESPHREAEQFHMHDRGTLEVGKAADLVLFDLNKLERGFDTFDHHGMPGGQNRYTRHAKGYTGVWVNGAQILENDEYTNVTGCGQVV